MSGRWVLVIVAACSSEPAPSPRPLPLPPTPAPPAKPSTADVRQLAAGNTHTCALHSDGAVSCWGSNLKRQLGVPAIDRTLYPIDVPAARGAVEISAAGDTTCIRRATGVVECWGQLGQQSQVEAPARVTDGIVQLAGRCFRRGDGGVECLTDAAQVVAIDVDHAIELASWRHAGCAVRQNNSVRCWNGTLVKDIDVPASVQVTVTEHRMCARTQSGDVHCWTTEQFARIPRSLGKATRGLVAGGRVTCVRTETNIECVTAGDPKVRTLDVPPDAPLALQSNDAANRLDFALGHYCYAVGRDVRCWGTMLDGELGNGWWRNRPVPTRVPGLANVVELGGSHNGTGVCARHAEGTVSCWGNYWAALPRRLPIQHVRAFAGMAKLRVIDEQQRLHEIVDDSGTAFKLVAATVVSANDYCLVPATGPVRCWTPFASDAKLPRITDAVEIAAHDHHAEMCARHRDGRVSCFSLDTDASRPITAIPDAIAIASATGSYCAIRANRTLWCWGSTESHVFDQRPKPEDVAPTLLPVGEVVKISLTRDNICVVRVNGTVACWGKNDHGQLGDGTLLPRTRPADVLGIHDAIDVFVGGGYACAAHRTGHVSCWGETHSGAVGTFETRDVTEPVPVVWP